MSAIGDKIKRVQKREMSYTKELGEKLGVSYQMIAQYESGKRSPKLGTLKKIADALDVPVSKLMFYSSIVDESAPEFITPNNNLDFLKKNKNTIETTDDNFMKLAESYHVLNKKGREKALDHVEMLTKIPEYRKDE